MTICPHSPRKWIHQVTRLSRTQRTNESDRLFRKAGSKLVLAMSMKNRSPAQQCAFSMRLKLLKPILFRFIHNITLPVCTHMPLRSSPPPAKACTLGLPWEPLKRKNNALSVLMASASRATSTTYRSLINICQVANGINLWSKESSLEHTCIS